MAANTSYAGSDAVAIDGIAKRAFAQGITERGMLAYIWAYHGGPGLPDSYMSYYHNVKTQLKPKTALQAARVKAPSVQGVPKNKEDFHYVIHKGGDVTDRSTTQAWGAQQNWDATDQGDRFHYAAKRIGEKPAVMGNDEEELSGTELVGSYLDVQINQKVLTLINGLDWQFFNALGAGSDLTGLLGICPVAAAANKNGFGQTAIGFAAHTIGNLAVTAAVNAQILPNEYPTAISGALTTPSNLLLYVRYALVYSGRPGVQGRIGVCGLDEFVTLGQVFENQNSQLMGIVYSKAMSGPLNVLLGEHLLLNGSPMVVDEMVPASHLIFFNLDTTGLVYKGPSLIQTSDIVDLSRVGYSIGSKGVTIESHPQVATCFPPSIAVISAWDLT